MTAFSDGRPATSTKTDQTGSVAQDDIFVPLDTSWFDNDPGSYLNRNDFMEFQDASGVDIRLLTSKHRGKVHAAQKELASRSIILNEIQSAHFGFGFPFLVYTHDLNFSPPISNHISETDMIILSLDMCDSLRRRHLCLSHAVIPMVINDLYQSLGRPLIIKNLGAGTGLDTLNAAQYSDGRIAQILNYDTNTIAISLGEKMTKHLEQQGKIRPETVRFITRSLVRSTEKADLIIKIGVICGLQDFAAEPLLMMDYEQLSEGGKLIVSSSNVNMHCHDPLASFLIQHIGSKDDPFAGWSLNCRSEEGLRSLLVRAGFKDIVIYSDTQYPGKENLSAKQLYGVDTLPSEIMGHSHPGVPLRLPPRDVLNQGTAYNWIAVASK
ncbi:MAG: hypothetical protein JW943_13550 [Deltaproteobacteria bacterium]|nr:hypothetical protein [Deltaproteobacteria bacterium]